MSEISQGENLKNTYQSDALFQEVVTEIRRFEIQLEEYSKKIQLHEERAHDNLVKEISDWRARGYTLTILIAGSITLLLDLYLDSGFAIFFVLVFYPFIHFMTDGNKKATVTTQHRTDINVKVQIQKNLQTLLSKQVAFHRTDASYWHEKKDVQLEEALKPVLEHAFKCSLNLTKASGDGGIDLMGDDNFGQPVFVQAKGWEGRAGTPIVREFLGSCIAKNSSATKILVCTGGFTAPALEIAEQNEIIALNADDLVSHSRTLLEEIRGGRTLANAPAPAPKSNDKTHVVSESNRSATRNSECNCGSGKRAKHCCEAIQDLNGRTAPTTSNRSSKESSTSDKRDVLVNCDHCGKKNHFRIERFVSEVEIECGQCGRFFEKNLNSTVRRK